MYVCMGMVLCVCCTIRAPSPSASRNVRACACILCACLDSIDRAFAIHRRAPCIGLALGHLTPHPTNLPTDHEHSTEPLNTPLILNPTNTYPSTQERCDPYKDATLPEAPPELVNELSRRYIMLYELITGERGESRKQGAGLCAAANGWTEVSRDARK